MTINLPLIRLVDDDDDYRASQSFLLSSLGWELKDWADPDEFLAQDDTKRPGCLVLDLSMPKMTGLEVQQALENRGSTLPIIFLTGHGDVTTAVRTLTHGAVDFIEKDSAPMRLVEAEKKAICDKSASDVESTTISPARSLQMRLVFFFPSFDKTGSEDTPSVRMISVSTLAEITEFAARIKLNGSETATSFPMSKYMTVPLFCSRMKFILSFTQSTPLKV